MEQSNSITRSFVQDDDTCGEEDEVSTSTSSGPTTRTKGVAGRKLKLCPWCDQLECDQAGSQCNLPRYRKRRICNPCGTRRNQQHPSSLQQNHPDSTNNEPTQLLDSSKYKFRRSNRIKNQIDICTSPTTRTKGVAGRKLKLCPWCDQLECDHCRCEGYHGCTHQAGSQCNLPRYRKRRICNPCGTKRRNQQHPSSLQQNHPDSTNNEPTQLLDSSKYKFRRSNRIKNQIDICTSASRDVLEPRHIVTVATTSSRRSKRTVSAASYKKTRSRTTQTIISIPVNKRVKYNCKSSQHDFIISDVEDGPTTTNNNPRSYYNYEYIQPTYNTAGVTDKHMIPTEYRKYNGFTPCYNGRHPLPIVYPSHPKLQHQQKNLKLPYSILKTTRDSSVTSNPVNMKKRCMWCGNYIPLSSSIDLYHYELICNQHQSRCAVVRYARNSKTRFDALINCNSG